MRKLHLPRRTLSKEVKRQKARSADEERPEDSDVQAEMSEEAGRSRVHAVVASRSMSASERTRS